MSKNVWDGRHFENLQSQVTLQKDHVITLHGLGCGVARNHRKIGWRTDGQYDTEGLS